MWRALTMAIRAGLLVACAIAIGFLMFVGSLSREAPGNIERADGIVALTGGRDRIQAAVRLLIDNKANRLLISGVNTRTTQRDLMRLLPDGRRYFDCCIDIGYDALDTYGNASETRDWVQRSGFKRIIVVTSSYHMPRSLAELERALPGVDFVPYPVVPGDFDIDAWWQSRETAWLLASEYLKYLPVAAQRMVGRISGTNGDNDRRLAGQSAFSLF